jgi:hypothetical protein
MKTFKDLEFKNKEMGLGEISRIGFDNGWGVSVVKGPYTYGGSEGLYELAVLNNDQIHYDNPVANGDVCGYLNENDVTDKMIEIQKFEKNEVENDSDFMYNWIKEKSGK